MNKRCRAEQTKTKTEQTTPSCCAGHILVGPTLFFFFFFFSVLEAFPPRVFFLMFFSLSLSFCCCWWCVPLPTQSITGALNIQQTPNAFFCFSYFSKEPSVRPLFRLSHPSRRAFFFCRRVIVRVVIVVIKTDKSPCKALDPSQAAVLNVNGNPARPAGRWTDAARSLLFFPSPPKIRRYIPLNPGFRHTGHTHRRFPLSPLTRAKKEGPSFLPFF